MKLSKIPEKNDDEAFDDYDVVIQKNDAEFYVKNRAEDRITTRLPQAHKPLPAREIAFVTDWRQFAEIPWMQNRRTLCEEGVPNGTR